MTLLSVVFFGTPAYSVPALRAFANDERFILRLVVTQPDRVAGRSRQPNPPAVKIAAQELGLPVYQPESLRSAEARKPLEDANAAIFFVAAYGLIFGRRTLAIPTSGCVNLHASILPAYRGASPVTAAILAGDRETGVTLMRMEAGLDTGPMIAVERTLITSTDTTESLTARLASLGAQLSPSAVAKWAVGEIGETPQPDTGATVVRPLVKADGWIDWSETAEQIERRVRAMWPWPVAWTTTAKGEQLQILDAAVVKEVDENPGSVVATHRTVSVACGSGGLRLDRVRLAGGKPIPAPALINGRKLTDGELLGHSVEIVKPSALVIPAS